MEPVINPPGLVVGSTWPSFWSGLWPSSHGFYCFRQLEAHSDVVRPYTPNDLAVPSFWSALAEAGRRVCIVDVPLTPLTRPAEGIHVQDWGTHDRMLPFAAWPDALEREIGRHRPLPAAGQVRRLRREGASGTKLYRTLEAGIEKKTALNLRLLERGPWDAFVSIYCESHCAEAPVLVGHDPTHPRYTAEAGDPLARVYALLDGALARMLERVSDDATVMVLLSHGIGSHHDADHLLREIVTRLDDAYGPASTLRVTTENAPVRCCAGARICASGCGRTAPASGAGWTRAAASSASPTTRCSAASASTSPAASGAAPCVRAASSRSWSAG
mgnify:CR=1 FL=1